MPTLFADLCAFFGITAEAPETIGELFPRLFQVLVCMAVVLYVFLMMWDLCGVFSRGRF